ncbi:hypothetical protein AB0B25_16340 [Nocardia sp. NPDC049190]|uniref:hypothetical protein n=1 Tax=Nocardia sp. NPDC049190 TaxID=3155650 RepID=UPI0033D0B461
MHLAFARNGAVEYGVCPVYRAIVNIRPNPRIRDERRDARWLAWGDAHSAVTGGELASISP